LTICCQVQAGQPNIVFLFSDDHAEQAIGAYGSKINKTPNIDRIAKEGAIFRNNFCTNEQAPEKRINRFGQGTRALLGDAQGHGVSPIEGRQMA
jgi:hypothetical protein